LFVFVCFALVTSIQRERVRLLNVELYALPHGRATDQSEFLCKAGRQEIEILKKAASFDLFEFAPTDLSTGDEVV
jgi:hypothetical protein